MKRMVFRISFVVWVLCAAAGGIAQEYAPRYFDIGTPTVVDLYVDPTEGSDAASGRSAATPFRTLAAAWQEIPMGATLEHGYRINLAPGVYPESALPNYLESRYGTFSHPIIIRSRGAPGSAILAGDLNVFDCRYLYILGVTIRPEPAGETFHCERCDHLLLRGSTFDGGGRIGRETIKINQSQHVFIENSRVSGASDNAIDFVAVQFGHIIGSRVSNAEDWCTYVKGGSASIRVENNSFFNCGTGGFTAGQGTGFEFMESPWLHYEAYDIKFFNNLVHDTEGAAIGVNGGFNIVMAFNTFYRVGRRSHLIEVVFGGRSCDGDTARCNAHRDLGGWGLSSGEEPIPNRHVSIFNNVVYNPSGFQSADQHFTIHPPRTSSPFSNIPSPARTDTDLIIRGNVISNGPSDLPLGVEDTTACGASNPTCTPSQLRSENSINLEPIELNDPANGDFRPALGSAVLGTTAVTVPNFTDEGRPTIPPVPSGNLVNEFPFDRGGIARDPSSPPGAYARPNSPLENPIDDDLMPLPPDSPSPNIAPQVRILEARSRRVSSRFMRVTLTARCSDRDGRITRVDGTVKLRGSRVIRVRLRRGLRSTYRAAITVRGVDSRGTVAVRATDDEGAATTRRKTL